MADYEYINSNGVIVPDTGDVKTQVQAEFQTAFGADLILTDNTPQGVLITAETLARITVIENNAALANQINPNIAGGVFLDAIWALTGGGRNPQLFSTASVNLAGVAGTVVPQGVTLKNSNGDIFQSISVVTLDGGGAATVTFQSLVAGPIAALAGTLTTIVNGVLGWETATNPSDAVLGVVTQSDESSRTLRRNTLALQGMSLPEAIFSALAETPGVQSLTFRENVASTTQVISGVTMVAHSIYVCVAGGLDLDVATVLLEKKSAGANYSNGAGIPVTVSVTEPTSGQVYPVSFDRPTLIPVLIRVTVLANVAVVDPTTTIQDAIIAYINGLVQGEPGFAVGVSVSCFELAGAVNQAIPQLFIQNVEITLASSISFSNAEIAIAVFQQATAVQSSISVVIV